MPVAFNLPSTVTFTLLPNWLVPAVLRSISLREMPLASPFMSIDSAGWLPLTTPDSASEPP